jgi:hypothetical protein
MSSPTWNGTLANMLVPTGWLEQPPTMPVGGSIWMISAILSNGGQTIVQQWSTPVRISGEKGESGSSPYMLDLSNENATVTATYAGVVEGAYPVCEAALYLGSSTVSPGLAAGNVTFRYSPTGCSIFIPNGIGTILSGNNSGWIAYTRFALNGGFNGDTATVTVEARTDGVVRDTKIMNISKAKGGADGTPATVFWLSLSNDVFKVSKTGVISPSQITIKALKQTGSDAVVEIPTGFGSYGLSLRRGETFSDGSSIDVPYSLIVIQSDLVTANMTSMNVKLLLNGVVIDIETIPIVRDGEDGDAGDSGQPGPGIAFRGIWSSGTQYNVLTQNIGGVNVPILRDVVKHNTVYYVALQSSLNRPPESNPDYWIAYNSFANIATGILLAEEAVIAGWKFAPGNSNYPQSGYFYSMGNQVIFDGRNVSDGNAGDGVSAGTSLPSNPDINGNYANFFPRAAFGASSFANRKSAPLRLYENGLIYTEKLHAKQGRVGNFNIADTNLYTDAGLYLNNDSILFNGTNITARFGTRVSSGYVFPLMQFLEDTTTNYSDQAVGIMINLPNRRYNRAIHVNAGDIASKGDVYSFGVSKLVIPSNTLWQLDQYMYHTATYNTTDYPTSLRFLCEYGSTSSGLLLPSRSFLLDKLGRDKTSSYDSVMVEFVFVSAVWTAAPGQIWGRNPNTNSGQNNTTAYPQIIDNSGNNANSVAHSKGRILKFLLHYQDASNYYAYFMISN